MSKIEKAVTNEFTTIDRKHLATINLEILGERIRRARIDKRLSQRTLVDGLFTSAYLSTLELGKTRPIPATLATLAERLDKSLDYFIHPVGEGSTNELSIEQDQLIQTKLLLLQSEASLAGGRVYEASQKLAEVKLHLGRLSTNEKARYFYLSGLAFIRQGEYKLALAELNEASQMLPVIVSESRDDIPLAILELTILVEEASGRTEYAQKRFTSALSHYQHSLEMASPTASQTEEDVKLDNGLGWKLHLELADTYVDIGETEYALEHFQAGLAELETLTSAASVTSPETGEGGVSSSQADRLLALAQSYIEQSDYTKALFYLGRSSQLYEHVANHRQLTELHNSLAKLQLRGGNYPAATKSAQTVLLLGEQNLLAGSSNTSSQVTARLTLARSYFQGGAVSEAEKLVSELLTASASQSGEIRLALYLLAAELAVAKGEREAGEGYYNQALTLLAANNQEQRSGKSKWLELG